MTLPRTKTIRFRMLALPLLGIALLGGCAPEPEPAPTPTAAFADEEEAFAAAEAVYRAYNDAGNARRDGHTQPDPQDFLVGTALESDIEAINQLRELGINLDGHVEVPAIIGVEADLMSTPATIILQVCLELAGTRVLDANGNDVTPQERNLVVSQRVTLVNLSGSLQISEEESNEDETCQSAE